MTHDIHNIRTALESAGLEIYQAHKDELEIAERVRVHMMDSGVRVAVDGNLRVRFSARLQRSDAPAAAPDDLFARVAEVVGAPAVERGYEETDRRTVEVKDPMDESKTLDTWHELVFERPVSEAELIDEVRWAIGVEKYVSP
ncbi:MAG: hypothetical protein AAF645_02355 [Myxococcota bacterium]